MEKLHLKESLFEELVNQDIYNKLSDEEKMFIDSRDVFLSYSDGKIKMGDWYDEWFFDTIEDLKDNIDYSIEQEKEMGIWDKITQSLFEDLHTTDLLKKYNIKGTSQSIDLEHNIITYSGNVNGHDFIINGIKNRNGVVWRNFLIDGEEINLYATKCFKKPFKPLKDGSIDEVIQTVINYAENGDLMVKKGSSKPTNESLLIESKYKDFEDLTDRDKINKIKEFVNGYTGSTIQEDFISEYGKNALEYLYWLDELGGITISPKMEKDSIYNPNNPMIVSNTDDALEIDYMRTVWDDIKDRVHGNKKSFTVLKESLLSDLSSDMEYVKKQYGEEVYNLLVEYTDNSINESHKLENVLYNTVYWSKFLDYAEEKLGVDLNEDLNEKIWDGSTEYSREDGWTDDDIKLHKSINWKNNNYEDYDAGDSFVGDITLFGLEKPIVIGTEFHKFLRANPIFPPYYKSIENKPFDVDNAYVGPMFDGHVKGNYNIHDRYETVDLYKELSK